MITHPVKNNQSQPERTVPYSVYQQLEQRCNKAEQKIAWLNRLFRIPAKIMSPSHKITVATTTGAIEHEKPGEEGFIEVESWKLGKQGGQGKAAVLNNLKHAEKLGILEKRKVPYYDEAGNRKTRLYIKPTPLLARPEAIETPDPRNHGGAREICPDCGSDRIQKRVICTCKDCGRVIRDNVKDLNHQHPSSEPEAKFQFEICDQEQTDPPEQETGEQEKQPDENHPEPKFQFEIPSTKQHSPANVNLTSNSKTPFASQVDIFLLQDEKPATPPMATLRLAAELLLDIAGTEGQHIRMNPKEGKKYYTNAEPLTLRHTINHLNGRYTYGARIDHADGSTRASIYDADNAQDIGRVRSAAQKLQIAGYMPIIELSPLGRAHLILIYTAHVQAKAAHRHECEIAPELGEIKEYWPSPAANKVRLPAGRYTRPEINDWCKLYDAGGDLLAQDGQSAAPVLLEYQTPAELIPDYPPEPEPERPAKARTQEHRPASDGVDDYHRQKYTDNHRMWVAFTPQQLAEWYNCQHNIDELLPRERSGQALAWWRGERTASVAFTKDGEAWVDFGATARHPDGKRDGGDALELATRMSCQEKADFMREVGQALNRELSREILRAARAGEHPATDAAARMTPEGWRIYRQNREKAGHAPLVNAEPAPESFSPVASHFENHHPTATAESTKESTVGGMFQVEIPGQEDTTGGVAGFSDVGGGVKTGEAPALFETAVAQEARQGGEPLTLIYDGEIPPPQRLTYCCQSNIWKWNAERKAYGCGGCDGE